MASLNFDDDFHEQIINEGDDMHDDGYEPIVIIFLLNKI